MTRRGVRRRGGKGGPAPVVVGTNSANAGNASSIAAALPASIAAGDLLVLVAAIGRAGAWDISTPSGWSEALKIVGPGNLRRFAIYTKEATGSEGSTVTVNSPTGSCEWVTLSYRITGQGSGKLAVSAGATGTSAAADPDAAVPTWRKGSLYLALCAHVTSSSIPSSAPAGYSNLISDARTSGSSVRAAGAQASGRDNPVDPGAFTLAASLSWAAATLVIG